MSSAGCQHVLSISDYTRNNYSLSQCLYLFQSIRSSVIMADKTEFLEMEWSGHDIVMSEKETGDKGKGKRKESGDESSA